MLSKERLELMKTLYVENMNQFRFFLTWRQLLAAGYFAMIGALALALRWAMQNDPQHIWLYPALGAVMSIVIWALDYRNHALYRISANAGSTMEKAFIKPALGYFSEYDKHDWNKLQGIIKHEYTLTILYIGGAVVLIGLSILSRFIDFSIAAASWAG
jgi:hypothetical protein